MDHSTVYHSEWYTSVIQRELGWNVSRTNLIITSIIFIKPTHFYARVYSVQFVRANCICIDFWNDYRTLDFPIRLHKLCPDHIKYYIVSSCFWPNKYQVLLSRSTLPEFSVMSLPYCRVTSSFLLQPITEQMCSAVEGMIKLLSQRRAVTIDNEQCTVNSILLIEVSILFSNS